MQRYPSQQQWRQGVVQCNGERVWRGFLYVININVLMYVWWRDRRQIHLLADGQVASLRVRWHEGCTTE